MPTSILPIKTPGAHSAFSRDKWLGKWTMSHDGWKGTLLIDGIGFGSNPYAVVARYIDSAGVTRRVNGNITLARPGMAKITINFGASDPQAFTLYYHGRDEGRFSGETMLSGYHYGVAGEKE